MVRAAIQPPHELRGEMLGVRGAAPVPAQQDLAPGCQRLAHDDAGPGQEGWEIAADQLGGRPGRHLELLLGQALGV